VPNATVQAYGVDYSELSASGIRSKADKARQQLNNLADRIPAGFETGFNVRDRFENADARYTLVTTSTVSGDVLLDSADLQETRIKLPAGEPLTLVVGDPTNNPRIQGEWDSQIPGTTIDEKGTEIVVEEIAAGGGVTSKDTVEIDESAGGGFVDPSELGYSEIELSPGYYRFYPKGSAFQGPIYQVGSREEIIAPIREGLKTRANKLSDRAQEVTDRLQNNKWEKDTATTNETGYYSISVGSNVKTAGLQVVGDGYQDLQALRAAKDSPEFNGSVVISTAPSVVDVPNDDVTLTATEVQNPPFRNISSLLNESEWRERLLDELNYGNVSSLSRQALNATNATREELTGLYASLDRLREQNDRLDERYRALLNQTQAIDDPPENVSLNPEGATLRQLRQNISLLKRTIGELQGEIDSEPPEVIQRGNDTITRDDLGDDLLGDLIGDDADTNATAANDTVSLRFPFDADLDVSNVAVYARYPNGSERAVSGDYWDVESRALGGDVVVVENYPLGDAASVTFRVDVATENGVGNAEKTVTNPTFNGTKPGLKSLAASTLRPSPEENVSLTLTPADAANFRAVEGVDVTLPNGTTVSGMVTGARSAAFDTVGAGDYHVEVTYSNPAGRTFSVATGITAGGQGLAMPAGVRVASGPAAGTYALVGEDLSGGSVELESGGAAATITAQIPRGETPPRKLHVYTTGASLQPDADVSVRVVEGAEKAGISRRVRVIAHLQSPPDGALLRRDGEPLPREGSKRADVVDEPGSLLIKTWTAEDGTVELSVNSNPGVIDRVTWRIDRTLDSLSLPGVPVVGSLAALPAPTLGRVAILGLLGAAIRRQWPFKPPPENGGSP